MNGLVPQKWHEVFGRVLAKKPDDRYQTATAFVQDLEYCLGAWFGAMGDDSATSTRTDRVDVRAVRRRARDGGAQGVPRRRSWRRKQPATVVLEATVLAEDPSTVGLKTPPVVKPPPAAEVSDDPATVITKAPPAPKPAGLGSSAHARHRRRLPQRPHRSVPALRPRPPAPGPRAHPPFAPRCRPVLRPARTRGPSPLRVPSSASAANSGSPRPRGGPDASRGDDAHREDAGADRRRDDHRARARVISGSRPSRRSPAAFTFFRPRGACAPGARRRPRSLDSPPDAGGSPFAPSIDDPAGGVIGGGVAALLFGLAVAWLVLWDRGSRAPGPSPTPPPARGKRSPDDHASGPRGGRGQRRVAHREHPAPGGLVTVNGESRCAAPLEVAFPEARKLRGARGAQGLRGQGPDDHAYRRAARGRREGQSRARGPRDKAPPTSSRRRSERPLR